MTRTRDLVYDELGRVERIDHFEDTDNNYQLNGNEDRIASFDYAYTVHNQQASLTEEFYNTGDGTLDTTLRYDWTYHALGRLRQEVFDQDNDGDSTGDYVDAFSYDLVGNRVRKRTYHDVTDTSSGVHDTTNYEYDANDRLLNESSDTLDSADATNTVYEYGTGNAATTQTGKTVRNGTILGQGVEQLNQTFEYNLQGRLSKSTTTENGGTPVVTEYEYNDDGIRVSQTVDGTKTVYLVDANNETGYAQVLLHVHLYSMLTRTSSQSVQSTRMLRSGVV